MLPIVNHLLICLCLLFSSWFLPSCVTALRVTRMSKWLSLSVVVALGLIIIVSVVRSTRIIAHQSGQIGNRWVVIEARSLLGVWTCTSNQRATWPVMVRLPAAVLEGCLGMIGACWQQFIWRSLTNSQELLRLCHWNLASYRRVNFHGFN